MAVLWRLMASATIRMLSNQKKCHSLTETVNQRPMRPFFGGFFHRYYNEVASSALRDDVCGGEMSLLPAIAFFSQLAFGIVNVNRYLRPLHLGTHPEPVFISFKQLLAHCFLLARTKIATPIVLAYLETFFDVGLRCLQRERLRVVYRCPGRR